MNSLRLFRFEGPAPIHEPKGARGCFAALGDGCTSYVPPLPQEPVVRERHLIAQGGGLLVVPEKLVPEFMALLIDHYEGTGTGDLVAFMKESCWRRLAI